MLDTIFAFGVGISSTIWIGNRSTLDTTLIYISLMYLGFGIIFGALSNLDTRINFERYSRLSLQLAFCVINIGLVVNYELMISKVILPFAMICTTPFGSRLYQIWT